MKMNPELFDNWKKVLRAARNKGYKISRTALFDSNYVINDETYPNAFMELSLLQLWFLWNHCVVVVIDHKHNHGFYFMVHLPFRSKPITEAFYFNDPMSAYLQGFKEALICIPNNDWKHPELKEGEVFFINVYPDDKWKIPSFVKSTRLGEVAYTTNGEEIVPGMKPMFGVLKK